MPQPGVPSFSLSAPVLVQPCNYHPGFKVGFGFGGDEWKFNAEYTWIRQSTSQDTIAAPTDVPADTTAVWLLDSWFAQTIGADSADLSATSVSSKWRLNMDILDVTGGRPYYQGQSLVISPYGGLRAAWIRQWLTVSATVPTAAIGIVAH